MKLKWVCGMPGLMDGKRGLIMGVANDHSIAWGIAKTARRARRAARLHLSGRRARPSASSRWRLRSAPISFCRATSRTSPRSMRCSPKSRGTWGTLDFLVHAIAFSDKTQLTGRYADTTRENFVRTMLISCFAFTEAAKRAAALMPNGGAMLTLTYNGGDARDAELQRHGRRQGGAGSLGALSRRRFRRAAASASTPSPPDRSARWPAPASATRARCSRSSSAIRRCIAA